ncbi:MAG: hypothetical protein JWO38_6503 [Gemmataceae bacterium]|nr:hypothetical protein [Gemmataceae bacterium]
MRCSYRGLLILPLVVLAAGIAGADDLTTIGGKKLTGKLAAVEKGLVRFQSGTSEVAIPNQEVLLVDLGHKVVAPGKDAKYHEIELTDGTRLRCGKFSVKGKKVAVELLPGPEKVAVPAFELPLSSVFYVLRGADDPKNRDAWKRMLVNRGKRDLYVIRQDDGLNFVQGTLLEGNPDGSLVLFEKEDGTKENLRLSRATGGLVFSQPQPMQVPQTLCRVVDVFGNTLVAQAVEMAGSGVKVTTVSGVVVTYPAAGGVAQLDYAQGNIAYLSDLQPQVEAPELPPDEANKTLNVRAAYLADRAPANAQLRLDGVEYPKGLWVPADTALTYTIGGDYREFKAVVGIHDQIGDGEAQVRVTIEADGRALFSETVKRKDKPKDVNLDIKNVKQVRIQVESETPFFNGGQAVLGHARVQK